MTAVWLMATNTRYVAAAGGGGGALTSTASGASTWETFTLSGTLADGASIALQASNGQWVCAEGGGGTDLVANRAAPGAWETFQVVRLAGPGAVVSGDEIALRSYSGLYVSAENGGDGNLNATRSTIGDWERFTVEYAGTNLRKAVVFGSNRPDQMTGQNSILWQPNGTYQNIAWLGATKTKWVRLWASWRWLQPYDGTQDPANDTRPYTTSPGWYSYIGGYSPQSYVQALDQQIAVARSYGLKVILTFWEFPRWANGTAAMDPNTASPTDRYNPSTGKWKPLEWRVPDSVTSTSDWGHMLEWLMVRYGKKVAFLEFMNEPNLQWWPQRLSDGTNQAAACKAVTMFSAAQALQNAHGGYPRLAGPATSDTPSGSDNDSALATSYQSFVGNSTSGLIGALRSQNFAANSGIAWTHHNYQDLNYDFGEHSTRSHVAGDTHAHDVRQRLVGQWTGWPLTDANNPTVLITEGGGKIDTIQNLFPNDDALAKQAALIQRSWNRMGAANGYSTADSPGIRMFSQYLLVTDASFDTGLINADYSGRPAYNTWGTLPAYYP